MSATGYNALEEGQSSDPPKGSKLRTAAILVGIVVAIVVVIVLVLAFDDPRPSGRDVTYEYSSLTGAFMLTYANKPVLSANLGMENTGELLASSLGAQVSAYKFETATLRITASNDTCYSVDWTAAAGVEQLSDCINFTGAWYGGPELWVQTWPVNNVTIPMGPYISGNNFQNHQSFGSVTQPYWLSSTGAAVSVSSSTPLHVSINSPVAGALCLAANVSGLGPYAAAETPLRLTYSVCAAPDAREMGQYALSEMSGPMRQQTPSAAMLERPIWSTWAKYKVNITQEKVLSFARGIVSRGYVASNMEIDDRYSAAYGDFTFDAVKFPSPVNMTAQLHALGFNVTLWVYPFANNGSAALAEGTANGYFVKTKDGAVAQVKWWHGWGAALDVTNPAAVQWFVGRLLAAKGMYNLDGFKFDAGEVYYVPRHFHTHIPLTNPSEYTTYYNRIAAMVGNMEEVRAAYNTQDLPLFVREMDRSSVWGSANGLRSVLTASLVFGMVGYPFVLPDMIGGNAYSNTTNVALSGALPSRELYIRWLELTTYLPAMQFSIAPWQYDNETVALASRYIAAHVALSPLLQRLAATAAATGEPIVRPIWWLAPQDATALACGDEFLLGEALLVAPVLQEGATSRDIYLPPPPDSTPTWWDQGAQRTLPQCSAGCWLRDYSLPLSEIGLFSLL